MLSILLLPVAATVAAAAATPANPHGRFHEECSLCHGAKNWKPVQLSPRFDHSKYGFALEGAHKSPTCKGCHASLEFSQQPAECVSCHQDPHRGEMGTECGRCHGARSFIDRAPMLRAHQLSRFPLEGRHGITDCEDCHHPAGQGQLQFANTSVECRSCHLQDYQATRNPNHVAAGMSLNCTSCHSPRGWSASAFDHDRSGFPLTGAHRAVACATCHPGGNFATARPQCASCHQGDYDRASPNHVASGFPASACAGCHNTTSFAGATFDHNATAFPLTGAHVARACNDCHGDGVYVGKPTACASCHQPDFNNASPNHVAAGFDPATCTTCHNTTAFTGARFVAHDASYFKIYSGRHSGRWSNDCSTCHTSPNAFASFTCLTCHGQASTDQSHAGRSGYSYTSAACYGCHRGV